MEKREKLEIDIDIKDLFWEFLRKWRIIVCCMLAGGIIMGAVAYVSDYKAANTPVAPVVNISTIEILEGLSEDEWAAIIAADALNTQIIKKSEYLAESVLMNIDSFSENRVVLEYALSGDVSAAMDSYKSWIWSGGFSDGMDYGIAPEYLNELVTITGSELNGVITVQILQADAESCATLAEDVKAAWQAYAGKLVQNGIQHECRLVTETQSVVVDSELHEVQDEYTKDVFADMETLAKKKTEMNASQITAYLLMIQGELESVMEGAGEEETVTTPEQSAPTVIPVKVSLDVKQVLIGMILGAVLAIVYIFLMYLMTGKLRTAGETEKLYGTRLLGTIEETKKKKKAFAAVDTLIWRLEHCRDKKLSVEERIELAVASIYIQCKKYNAQQVYVSGSKVAEIAPEVLQKLKEMLERKDIVLVAGSDVTGDAEALVKAAETGSVILLEKERKSAYKDILKTVQACAVNHIQVLGMIVVEQ